MNRRDNMRNRKLSFLARLCVFILLINALGGFALAVETPVEVGYKEIPLYLDGKYIGAGYLIGDFTFVPVVSFCETMMKTDFIVNWNQEDQTVTLDALDVHISFDTEDTYFMVNDRYLYLPDGAYNVNGTLLMPIRTLAKIFNVGVNWNSNDWSVSLDLSQYAILESGSQFYDEDSLYWLSHVISSESGVEPFLGQIAVGNVVLNRAKDTSGFFPDTIKGVIFQSGQFQVVSNGTIYKEPYEESVIAAKLCLEGYNVVGESLYFLNPAVSPNYWWFRSNLTYVTTIKNHEFYA